jgi:hypothetical protein
MRLAVVACVLGACADPPLQPPTGRQVKYVISGLDLPRSNTDARLVGFDLNSDAKIDNQLGMVLSTIGVMGLDPGLNTQQILDRGELLTLVQVQYAQKSDPSDSIAVTLFDGATPSPPPCDGMTCGLHLRGDGQFTAEAQQGEPMLGERTRLPMLVVGPGALTTSIPIFGEVVELVLATARVRIDEADDQHLAGAIGGGLAKSEVEKIVATFQHGLTRLIAEQCTPMSTPPRCGCPDSGNQVGAEDWLGWFDAYPQDCVITFDELINNNLVVSLVLPDLLVDDEKVLSVGFHFEAVSAAF